MDFLWKHFFIAGLLFLFLLRKQYRQFIFFCMCSLYFSYHPISPSIDPDDACGCFIDSSPVLEFSTGRSVLQKSPTHTGQVLSWQIKFLSKDCLLCSRRPEYPIYFLFCHTGRNKKALFIFYFSLSPPLGVAVLLFLATHAIL